MKLKVSRQTFTVSDFAEASRIYSELRDASGLGASRFANGQIYDGKRIAYVSYNGKIWPLGHESNPDAIPLYDPYASE